MSGVGGDRPLLSIVVVAYDMARELPRTLRSLDARYQDGMEAADYELIVVDNGSPTPVDPGLVSELEVATRLIRIDPATPSPAPAVNRGLELAAGDLIGVFVDGARLASPGLLRGAMLARRLSDRPVIAALGWHLGDDTHMRAAATGHDRVVEDAMLAAIGWPRDGYRLFEISVLAGSSARGWFGPLGESNSLFLQREAWDALGGFDERFVSPGGGRANSDAYRRACELDGSQLVVLLGEGTFHQIHGGSATSGGDGRERADVEYRSIRGVDWRPPDPPALFVGTMPDSALPHLERSVRWRLRRAHR